MRENYDLNSFLFSPVLQLELKSLPGAQWLEEEAGVTNVFEEATKFKKSNLTDISEKSSNIKINKSWC